MKTEVGLKNKKTGDKFQVWRMYKDVSVFKVPALRGNTRLFPDHRSFFGF